MEGCICCITRSGSTLPWVVRLDSTTEFSTCCTGTDLTIFRVGWGGGNNWIGSNLRCMLFRNELRPANGVLAAWGNGDFNDWAAEAQVIGNRILEINPDILIFVEGILSAGNLIGALTKKVELTNPSKLVYSGHIYPFRSMLTFSFIFFHLL